MIRKRIFQIVENPPEGYLPGIIFSWFIMTVIGLNVLSVILETEIELYDRYLGNLLLLRAGFRHHLLRGICVTHLDVRGIQRLQSSIERQATFHADLFPFGGFGCHPSLFPAHAGYP